MKKQKLELTWVGKDERIKLEPRVLVEEPDKSYGDKYTDNMLIYGDNLLSLKALEQDFTGRIKCIYIDPPYNTGQAFEHYDDGLEHSIWLGLMRDRLQILKNLLTPDGTLFCQLNDDEAAYGKVLLDEVFGRSNFLNQVSVKMKLLAGASGGGEDKKLKKNIEHILIYARGYDRFEKFNDVFEEVDLFELIDAMNDEGKSWKYTSIIEDIGDFVEEKIIPDGSGNPIKVKKYQGIKRTTVSRLINEESTRENVYIENFDKIFSDTNAQTSIRTRIIEEFKQLNDNELLIASYIPISGRDKGNTVHHYYISPTIRRVIWLKDSTEKRNSKLFKKEKIGTYWEGFPLNNLTKEGGVRFPQGKKPEALIQRILELATNEGDYILDSFAGSGTTGAVAQKMGRKWIMCELGEHCHTHIIPRMQRVIDGIDQGGISKTVNWQGGGGFKYYRLAESLLVKDKDLSTENNPVYIINPRYNEELLIKSICKIENFRYRNDGRLHGISSENRFLHVTTRLLTQVYLESLAEDISKDQSLLVYCTRKSRNLRLPENVEIKKIPKNLLEKCDFEEEKK